MLQDRKKVLFLRCISASLIEPGILRAGAVKGLIPAVKGLIPRQDVRM